MIAIFGREMATCFARPEFDCINLAQKLESYYMWGVIGHMVRFRFRDMM